MKLHAFVGRYPTVLNFGRIYGPRYRKTAETKTYGILEVVLSE